MPARLGASGAVVAGGDGLFSRSRAANPGAAEASGEWLVFCSDAAEVVEPDWLSQLLSARAPAGRGRGRAR